MLQVRCEKCKCAFECREEDFKSRTAHLFYVQCPKCEQKIFADDMKDMSFATLRDLREKFKSRRLLQS